MLTDITNERGSKIVGYPPEMEIGGMI